MTGSAARAGKMLIPLALAQFIASFAGSNMNVAINSISKDLHTDVHGVQTAITLFLLCMAALMIPGSKLTDKFGRKQCFIAGLSVYGTGVGVMMTPSVNLVQSSFEEQEQGEISGLSRAVSNLGSSLGTAIAGTILITLESRGNHAYAVAMIVLAAIGLIGLGAAMLLPANAAPGGVFA